MSHNPLNSHNSIEKVSSLDLDSSSKSLQKAIRLTSQSSFLGALKVDAQVLNCCRGAAAGGRGDVMPLDQEHVVGAMLCCY